MAEGYASLHTTGKRQVSVTSSDGDDGVVQGISVWKDFRKKFGPYGAQIVVGILIEVAWCACIGGWMDMAENASATSVEMEELHLNQRDESNIKELNWIVFLVCLAARCMAISFMLRKHRRHTRCTVTASAASAMYIVFAITQWVFYFAAYYHVLDSLTTVTFAPQVQVERIASHDAIRAINGTNMTDGGAIDVVNANVSMTMRSCLAEYPPLDCVSKVNRRIQCKHEYDPDVCSGYTWMGKGKAQIKCCVTDVYGLTVPDDPVPYTNGQSLDTVFMVLKWLAVLSIAWTIKDLPIVPSSAQSSGFLQGCWLDLMDSVVFGAYLSNNKVLYPKYGIDLSDGTAADVQDDFSIRLLIYTWLVAFVLATLSPALYTFYSHSEEEEEGTGAGTGTGSAPRDFAQSAEKLIRSLQLLERESALDHLEECLAVQRELYVQQSIEADCSLMVHVAPEKDEDPEDLLKKGRSQALAAVGGLALRPGKATTQRGGTYSIQYTDGSSSEEEIVPVGRVFPDVSTAAQQSVCGPGCCKGWCGAGDLGDNFERKANVIDSVRSLFSLEVPFLLWRLYFEWDGLTIGSFALILMLKNLVWAVMDLLTILSCGDQTVTFLGMMPVSILSEALEGSPLSSVFVGPAGLFSIAASAERKVVAKSIEANRRDLKARKAWLIIERQKADDDHDVEANAVLTKEIELVEGQIAALAVKDKLNHA